MTPQSSAGNDRHDGRSPLAYTMRCVFTNAGVIRFASDRFLTMIGQDPHTLTGNAIQQHIHPEDVSRLNDTMTKVDESARMQICELRWRMPDQSYSWLSWYIGRVGDDFEAAIFDISTRKVIEEAMGEGSLYYQGLLQSQIDLVSRYLPDTTLVYINDAYCNFFKLKREEWIGKSFLPLAAPDHIPEIYARINEVMANPIPKETITKDILEDGTSRWVQWIDYGVVNADGEVVAIQAVGRDITLLKRTEEELAKEREVVEFRKRLMSMISHEFRTPLTVIQTASEMLLHYRAKLPHERQDMYLVRITAQVQRLIQMLDDVVLLDKSENHLLKISVKPMNLVEFFTDMIDDFRMTYRHHNIQLNMNISDESYCSDKHSLGHIFENLIGNALRYTPEGKAVTVDVRAREKLLQVRINDEGIGIPEEEQDQIFNNFYRAKNTVGIPGTGLGLSIVKQYVDLLDGTVRLESRVEHGTQFHVTLPSMCDD